MRQDIKNGNKIIAEFMEFKIWYKGGCNIHVETSPERCESIEDWGKYHELWEWLMPVIEKICRLKIGDGIEFVEYAEPRTFGMLNSETGKIMVRLNGFQLFQSDSLIEATFNAVVDFIEHYKKMSITHASHRVN